MRKTGESYTTAHAQLLDKKKRAARIDHAKVAGTSDEAVEAKTGRTWAEWVHVLDGVDAAGWPHKKIEEMKFFWGERLAALGEELAG